MRKNVKNFIYKDKNLFAMLARTNLATEEQINTFMGTRRVESHIKDGLLEKVSFVVKNKEKSQAYFNCIGLQRREKMLQERNIIFPVCMHQTQQGMI